MDNPLLQIKNILSKKANSALLLTHLPDIRWATGFSGSNGLLLVLQEAAHFFTDGRYAEQALHEVQDVSIHVPGYDLSKHLAEIGLLDRVHFAGFQADHVTVHQLAEWQSLFPNVEWLPLENVLTPLVAVKNEAEIARIRGAQAITEAVFTELLDLLVVGLTEREVAAEIVYRHLRHGAEKMSFDPIVASGPNGALPHAQPSDRRLKRGDLVVMDMGCFYEGYASDMTRTVAIGDPGNDSKHLYRIVHDAQARALETARAGITTKVLDAAARDMIAEAGYGEQFSHGLGHGVGLQIHEWPRISQFTDDMLPAGAVVTIEPGVYLPGRFGVRIEDLIVLREDGIENLTSAPKELLVL